MTHKQAIFRALRHQPVDRVPVASYNLHPYDARHGQDASYRDLLDLVVATIGMYCKRTLPVLRRPEADTRNASRPVAFDSGAASFRQTRRDGDLTIVTTILPTPKGDLRSVVVTPDGQPSLVTEHLIKTDTDIDRFLAVPWDPPAYDTGPLRAFADRLGERGVLTVSYADPMYAAASLFEFVEFCTRYATRPSGLRRLIDHLFGQIIEDTRLKAEACRGMDVIFLTAGPELATPPMMPPRAFAELVVPYQKRLIEILHDAGHLAMIHCHGRVGLVLDHMLATGVDAIEPIEPPPQGDVALAELLQRAEGRLALMGHIQDQDFHSAPPGAMTRRVEAIAGIVDGRTGYVMMPTCTPFAHPATETFLRNYTEWVEAAARVLGGA